MNIKLYNTLSKEKETFKPIKDLEISMYHCGPTVYERAHIGNMRPYIIADILRRTFEYQNYKVNQVMNITDVGHLTSDSDYGDDKLEKSAKEKNISAKKIANKFIGLFKEDLDKLNINTQNTIFPKATEHIEDQIELIKKLEEKGFTYLTSDGIYFDTSLFNDYGKLGQIDINGLKEGARINKNIEKKNPTDFALWKFSKEKRQQEWDSPWGIGFPGWHIECSAMAEKYLDKTFDIHTGGIDHIPIHHNNEIAQSEAVNNVPLSNYWLHINHITVDGQKMSKSIGNIYSLDDLESKGLIPLSYKYFILTGHYRTLINFTWEALEASSIALNKLAEALSRFSPHGRINQIYKEKFIEFINNDLNTPQAIALIWDLIKDESVSNNDKRTTIIDFDKILGLNLNKLIEECENKRHDIPKDILEMANERDEARESKNFTKSDSLREMIEDEGYEVIDTDSGSLIRKK